MTILENATATDLNVTITDLNVTPTDLNVTPTDLSGTPTDSNAISTDLNVTPTDLNVTPTDLSATPIDLNVTPTDSNAISTDLNVTTTDLNVVVQDTMIGTVGSDVLTVTTIGGVLRGLEGRDTLIGSVGDDTLVGGLDGDTLTGGAGFDQFVYESFSERTDTITDFNPLFDQIVFTQVFDEIDYQGINPTADGYLRFVQNGSDTKVQIDPDGVSGPYAFRTMAVLENVVAGSLTVGDNVIV